MVWAMYFSATGTTEAVITAAARAAARELGVSYNTYDFTLPAARRTFPEFAADDLVFFGTPTYAGRVPNVLLPYLKEVRGRGAAAAAVVLFGNRDFDDALIELRDLLTKDGFAPMAAAAFVGEHSFSDTLAAGRPDADDIARAVAFGKKVAERVGERTIETVEVPGVPEPYRGYYQPRDRAGAPIDIRRVKPRTSNACDECGQCVNLCPMGAIDAANVREYIGICIKCGACIKKCPRKAKYYDDSGYLYHKTELEEQFTRRAQVRVFL